MKILLCAYDRSNYHTAGPNSWIQRLVFDLRNNFQLDITTLFFYSGDESLCPTISFFRDNEMPFLCVSMDKYPYMEDQVLILLRNFKKGSFTVLLANLVLPAYYAVPFLRPYSIPVIGVFHSYDPFYLFSMERFLSYNQNDSFTHVVSVSRYIQHLAEKWNLYNTKLYTIPCGIPFPQCSAKTPYGSTLKIVYAGRLVEEAKQILRLTNAFIDASKIDDRLDFTILGSGEKERAVMTLLNSRMPHRVHYGGVCSASEMMAELSNYHVFTLMSDYEGVPIALMEAMGCGLVPVCLDEPSGIRELIQHEKNGFIVQDVGLEYSERLAQLIDQPGLWNRLSLAARTTIETGYSTEINNKKWMNLFDSIAHSPAKRIHIPFRISIKEPPKLWVDFRKPSLSTRFSVRCSRLWLAFRCFVRPRARLRALMNQIK